MGTLHELMAADTDTVFLNVDDFGVSCVYLPPGGDADDAVELVGIPEYHVEVGQGQAGATEQEVRRPDGESVVRYCRLWLDPDQALSKDGTITITDPNTSDETRWAIVRSLGNHGPLTAWLLKRSDRLSTRGLNRGS